MKQYLDQLQYVLTNGTIKEDRTNVGVLSVFGMQQRYDLSKGFPAVTTKKLAWRAVVSELLWFIEGSGDEKRLREILHDSRASEKATIWTANAAADYWQESGWPQYEGDLGRIYGVQWRDWQSPIGGEDDGYAVKRVDQLRNLIEGIKKDPYGRRHILTAWNPGELDRMALPPCHCFAQFYVANGKLSCQMYQRSCDLFLGIPFNIASYALFTHMIAQCCDLEVGEFIHTLGDAHIYSNHVDQVKEQLNRDPLPSPTLWLNPAIKKITDFTMDDIKLEEYQHHPPIFAPMAV